MNMDLSVFNKFNFEYSPVGVKFLLAKPKNFNLLGKKLSFCEMVSEAQKEGGFYVGKENHECLLGPYLLGMVDGDPIFESGQMGPKLGVYSDASANRRVYNQMHKLAKGSVNYILFAPLKEIDFDPDLLIVVAKPSQAEVILRAKGYYDGSGWNAKGTSVGGCAYMYSYPYVTGEINLMVSGLHHGMKARKVYPEGLLFLSIPFNLLRSISNALENINWDLPQYSWGKETHLKKMKEFAQEVQKDIASGD